MAKYGELDEMWNRKVFCLSWSKSSMHCCKYFYFYSQWRIQYFPQGGGGAPTSKIAIMFQIFAENCMKMKEFGPSGGGGGVPGAPPWIR